MMEPFSVAMCVYRGDDAQHFRTALDSVLSQTRPPAEVVLVVDGPIPSELEKVVAECEANPLFRVIRFSKNQGHGNARRAGLEACSNRLVALMDADDISLPERFEIQLAAFENEPEVSVIGGQIAEFIGEPENTVGRRIVPLRDEEIKQYMKRRCPFNQMSVMLRKEDVQKAGGYLDWYCNEDYYLWLRMALMGMRFANVPQTLVRVRASENMYRRRGGLRYYRSEKRLQGFMRKNGVISFPLYCLNVLKRLTVQVLMPARLRGWVFRHLARE